MKSNIFNNRRFKYGSAAIIFTAIFIAIIMLINGIISLLDSKIGLYADLTSEQRYEISDVTTGLLADIPDSIEIIFCRDRDKLIEDNYMSMIVTLAEKYELSYPNVTVKFVDRARHPGEINKFRRSTSDIFSDTDVIINAPESGKFRHLRRTAFFSADSDGNLAAFNGEMRITASILAVTRASNDKVALITGHDEAVSTPLVEVLMNAGYDTAESLITVNLATADIPENTRLVIIDNPKRDFLGYTAEKTGSVNEIAKLDKYLKNYGNLFVAIDNETPFLPELCEYLQQEWGISYTPGLVIQETPGYSISTDGRSLIANYNLQSDGTGIYSYEITRRVSTTSARTIVSSATPLTITPVSGKTVSPVLTTSAEATVLDDNVAVQTGKQTLMAISSFLDYPDGMYEKLAHVVVCGSTDFVYTDMAVSSSANADLVYSILNIVGTEKVPIDIQPKMFSDTSIDSIGMATARSFTFRVAAIPALIVLAFGVYVFIRRKRL